MNQLFTRLPLLLVMLVGFFMPSLYAQPDGIDAADTDDAPCFAIWDTDEDRGKSISPILRRFIDIFIPNSLNCNKYRAVVRFYDQAGNLISIPGPSNNNGLIQEIWVPNNNPSITTSAISTGKIYTYELNPPFSQGLVAYISLELYGFHLNTWMPLHNSNNPLWDVNSTSPRIVCWGNKSNSAPQKGDPGRLGSIEKEIEWVFPNPTSGLLQITAFDHPISLEIFDIRGTMLKSWELPASEFAHKISVQAFPAGIYYLKLQMGTELKYRRIQVQ